ncbi:hypothetical protein WT81_06560 [Burkholderia stagnalis]|uniref:hypothetical protein n=1 Tax=Burkholderia stagnalis TaxID=1503054 RepID=UPI00075FA844|nr:hypothetical protein [Burkholderia stagnalis]KWK56740.1 hypothetical protein WT80_31600 [Burkholderia stagnalis]KWK64688.1 hypothetical protein WT81_06560 [Burkholderia stagnalis]KWN66105.1 hypothetical protein WT90_32055 [Burkholderia stagnalis]
MRDPSAPYRIAAARGALDAGAWAIVAALAAAGAGWWVAAGWMAAPLARALLAAVSTASGVAALWYAVRIAIDRRLFAALAHAATATAPDGAGDALAALDRALADLGWIDAAKAGRALDARVRGAIGLCRAGMLTAVIQWAIVGAAIAMSGF